jgi:hypothetical protein
MGLSGRVFMTFDISVFLENWRQNSSLIKIGEE